MANFAQNVNFLQYLLPAVGVLHVSFIDSFDSNISTCQLMNRKCDFTESALTNQLNKFVELEGGSWHSFMFLEEDFVVFYKFLPLNHDLLVDSRLFIVGKFEIHYLVNCSLSGWGPWQPHDGGVGWACSSCLSFGRLDFCATRFSTFTCASLASILFCGCSTDSNPLVILEGFIVIGYFLCGFATRYEIIYLNDLRWCSTRCLIESLGISCAVLLSLWTCGCLVGLAAHFHLVASWGCCWLIDGGSLACPCFGGASAASIWIFAVGGRNAACFGPASEFLGVLSELENVTEQFIDLMFVLHASIFHIDYFLLEKLLHLLGSSLLIHYILLLWWRGVDCLNVDEASQLLFVMVLLGVLLLLGGRFCELARWLIHHSSAIDAVRKCIHSGRQHEGSHFSRLASRLLLLGEAGWSVHRWCDIMIVVELSVLVA